MFDNKKEAVDTRENEEVSTELNIEELEQRLEMANPACTRCCVADQSNLKPKRRKVISKRNHPSSEKIKQ